MNSGSQGVSGYYSKGPDGALIFVPHASGNSPRASPDVAIKVDKKQSAKEKKAQVKADKEQARADRIRARRERTEKSKQLQVNSTQPSFGTKSQMIRVAQGRPAKRGGGGAVDPVRDAMLAGGQQLPPAASPARPQGRLPAIPSGGPVPPARPMAATPSVTMSQQEMEDHIRKQVEERMRIEEARIRQSIEQEYRKQEMSRLAQEEAERQVRSAEEQRRQKEAEDRVRDEMTRKQQNSEAQLRKTVEEDVRRDLLTGDTKELRSWDIDPNDLEIFGELGSGAFGVVWKGKLYGKDVAIKQLNMEDTEEDVVDSFKKEVEIMVRLRHPNILLFMGACFKEDNLMLVTELMPRGSVDDMIHGKHMNLPFKQRIKIARDCALGMNWLHNLKPPFLHLDLKTGNLLVDDSWNVKVADFGLSQIKGSQEGPVGSPFYMAPEMLMNKPYTERADLYSFGIVLWELLTQEEPYKDEFEDLEEFIEAIVGDGERPPIPDTCPPSMRELLLALYDADPEKRPTFNQMLSNRVFDHILIEATISDPTGQQFWKTHHLETDTVDWATFLNSYRLFSRLPKESFSETKPVIKALRKVLTNKDDAVTMESFSAACLSFGPLHGFNLIDNVERICSQPWFYGDLPKTDAELLLNNRKPGTFLVRFSETSPGAFAISCVGKTGIANLRITRDSASRFVLKGAAYESLFEVVKLKQLKLKISCPGSPYQTIFNTTKVAVDANPDYGSADYGAV